MTAMDRLNPAAFLIYYTAVMAVTMFLMHPAVSLLSLLGALCLYLPFGRRRGLTLITAAAASLGCAVLNPFFSHGGETVLLVINDKPLTLEAFLYGAAMGVMVSAAVLWSAVFASVMTSDKLIYCFGRLSPKAALTLSMALRFIPLLIRQAKSINDAQKVMGIYKDETIVSRFKGSVRVFSALISRVTETTVITADSMAARGFLGGRRVSYAAFRFRARDAVFIGVTAALFAFTAVMKTRGGVGFDFYPRLSGLSGGFQENAVIIGCGLLFFFSSLTQGGEALRWRFLLRKI